VRMRTPRMPVSDRKTLRRAKSRTRPVPDAGFGAQRSLAAVIG
jgi:hypothetical protein